MASKQGVVATNDDAHDDDEVDSIRSLSPVLHPTSVYFDCELRVQMTPGPSDDADRPAANDHAEILQRLLTGKKETLSGYVDATATMLVRSSSACQIAVANSRR